MTPLPVLGKVQGVEHEDTVGALVRLGLTRYEARAFIALMGRGSFTAAEVARRANLPRQRIYDVLGSLVHWLAIYHRNLLRPNADIHF